MVSFNVFSTYDYYLAGGRKPEISLIKRNLTRHFICTNRVSMRSLPDGICQ